MLIFHHKEIKRKKSHSSDCVHYRYNHKKCVKFTSSFFVHLFVVTTIMATSPSRFVIAMNILTDRIHIREDIAVQRQPEPDAHNQIVLNEKWPAQIVNGKGRSMTIPLDDIGTHLMVAKDRDQSKHIRKTLNSLAICNCSNGRTLKRFQLSRCMQICSHQHRQQQHSPKFKRKRKQSDNNGNSNHISMEKREHLTLIHGIDAISNSALSNQRIVPIQSSELTSLAKYKKRAAAIHRHRIPIIELNEKSLNNNNAHETNILSRIQVTTNLHEMALHPDKKKHLVNSKNIDIKNNHSASHGVDESMVLKYETDHLNANKMVERKKRSISKTTIPKPMHGNAKNMTEWQPLDWSLQKTVLSAAAAVAAPPPSSPTKDDSTNIKSTENAYFDSAEQNRGGVAKIIATATVDANRTNTPTTSSKYNPLLDFTSNFFSFFAVCFARK